MKHGTPEIRYAEIERETRETRIQVVIDLDGGVRQDVSTGLSILDQMLVHFASCGQLNLGVKVDWERYADDHHVCEDVGIAIGKALRESLRETEPVVRFASNHTPVNEALVLVAVDVTGRGSSHFNVEFKRERLGDVATENIRELFRCICTYGGLTAHFNVIAGENDHHVCEAVFKAFGRAIFDATRVTEQLNGKS